jgi:hypothetical protein
VSEAAGHERSAGADQPAPTKPANEN